jgi:hypothetical protein
MQKKKKNKQTNKKTNTTTNNNKQNKTKCQSYTYQTRGFCDSCVWTD